MTDRGRGASFVEQTVGRASENLEGDDATKATILSPVNFAGPAGAQALEEAIVGDKPVHGTALPGRVACVPLLETENKRLGLATGSGWGQRMLPVDTAKRAQRDWPGNETNRTCQAVGRGRMKAMILAAGFGTRLWPLTEDRTKPAVPFLGKPLVAYSLEYVHRFGVREVVVNLHHRGESVRDALGDGSGYGCRVFYSMEDEILGTGGALDRARDHLDGDDFIVVNGKIVTDIELGSAIAEHRAREAVATLVLLPNVNRERFTIVERDSAGLITRFDGYPDPENPHLEHPLMFTGIQILSPRIFEYIPRGRFSHTTTEAFPAAIAAGDRVVGHVGAGSWKEMSTLERYLDESLAAAHVAGQRNVVGQRSRIDDAASVDDSVLWKDVTVAAGATVRRSILGDGVRVPGGARIEDSVVVRAEIVRKIERGRLFGDLLVAPIRPVLD